MNHIVLVENPTDGNTFDVYGTFHNQEAAKGWFKEAFEGQIDVVYWILPISNTDP